MTASLAETRVLPLLPLRDVVVFPHMVIPLFVGRPKSIKALEAAMEEGKNVVLVAQKSAAKDEPAPEDLYAVGTVSTILQMLKLPDGTVKVLVEGVHRAHIRQVLTDKANFEAEVEPVAGDEADSTEIEAMRRTLLAQFDQYVKLNKKIPPEVLTSLSGIDGAGRLSDTIAAHLPLKLEQKQQILEMAEVGRRLEQLLALLETEIDILQVEKRIRGRVKRQMEKSQREYYLNEQVKAIQKELGEGEDGADFDDLERKIKAARMPQEARKKVEAVGEVHRVPDHDEQEGCPGHPDRSLARKLDCGGWTGDQELEPKLLHPSQAPFSRHPSRHHKVVHESDQGKAHGQQECPPGLRHG